MHMIETYKFPFDEIVQIEAQRSDVLREFLGVLLEHHENARLAKLERPADYELSREHRLSCSGRTANERGPTRGEAAERNFVKPAYARRCLFKRILTGRSPFFGHLGSVAEALRQIFVSF